MSDQHEQDQEHEVVPVEVAEDHEVVESDASEDRWDDNGGAAESEDDGVEAASDSSDPAVEADGSVHDTSEDLWREQYERACADPEFAAQYAIEVNESDYGPAWEHGSLAAYELYEAHRLTAEQDEADHDDDSEEV